MRRRRSKRDVPTSLQQLTSDVSRALSPNSNGRLTKEATGYTTWSFKAKRRVVDNLQVLADALEERQAPRLANDVSFLAKAIQRQAWEHAEHFDIWFPRNVKEWAKILNRINVHFAKDNPRSQKRIDLSDVFSESRKTDRGEKYSAYRLSNVEAIHLIKLNGIARPRRGWEAEVRVPHHVYRSGESTVITQEYVQGKRNLIWVLRRHFS